jgi:hypothetical protein
MVIDDVTLPVGVSDTLLISGGSKFLHFHVLEHVLPT